MMDLVNHRMLSEDRTMATAVQRLREAASTAPDAAVDAAAQVLQAGQSPLHGAFAARAMRALARLLPEADERTIGEATGAPSDYEVLLRVLEDPATLSALRQADPLDEARVRGLRAAMQILDAAGGTVGVEEAANLLHLTRQGVDRRRRSGRLIGLPAGRRGYRYPVWQFAKDGTLPGLEATLAALHGHDPWMQAVFMLNTNTRLDGQTPLHALQAGRLDAVLAAAQMYGEHGAA
jgi:hypothetical protein